MISVYSACNRYESQFLVMLSCGSGERALGLGERNSWPALISEERLSPHFRVGVKVSSPRQSPW